MHDRNRTLVVGLALSGLATFSLLWWFVAGYSQNAPTALDSLWESALRNLDTPVLTAISLTLNLIGGTRGAVVIGAIIAIVLMITRRPWSAAYLVTASLAGALVVQLVKALTARPRPEDMMVTSDFGSFPSGHSANAAVLAVVLLVLFSRRPGQRPWLRWVLALYVVLMMISRAYLSAHWLSDTIAGALLGTSIALLIALPFAKRIAAEFGASREGGRDPLIE